MKRSEKIVIGSVLIILGVIFALNALEITDIDIFFKGWWTLFIIVPSFIGLFHKDERSMSIVPFIVGVLLLLGAQGLLSFATIWKLIIPVILICIGVAILFKDNLSKKATEKMKELNANRNNLESYSSIFGSQQASFENREFVGANLNASFGSVDLNLRKATITKDVIINANAIFGGVTIIVPENVNIEVKSSPIFGGVTNKAKAQYNESLPTLYIDGTAVFGEIDIR